jgi:putative colanic acid biosynthesis glycosyltransferase WcaI
MKILFVTQWFEPEPGAIRGLPLARWLAAHEHEVRVLTGVPNYPGGRVYPGYRIRLWQREVMDGIPVLRVPLYPSHDASALGRVANYTTFALSAATLGAALVEQADVAYVYHPPATVGLPAIMLKALRGMPFVYHIADMWPEAVVASGMLGDNAARRVVERLLAGWCRLTYGQAGALSVLSPGFKRLLLARGVPSQKMEVIYNWTDETVFKPVERDPGLAAALGLTGRFNIVYAGNLGAFQGLDTVIRAAAMIRGESRIQVVLSGTGQCEAQLKSLARELGADNVRFLGHREYSEMPRINALADVLLVHLRDMPFLRGTIPSKTQVSLASARPILMAVRGDASDIVRDAGAGATCGPEDPAELADAMRKLFETDREELDAMGARGRAYYLERMSLEVGAPLTEALLRRVAGTTGPRR